MITQLIQSVKPGNIEEYWVEYWEILRNNMIIYYVTNKETLNIEIVFFLIKISK